MITVMGATGNVGRKIVHRLLEAGEPVRAIGRNPRALAELAAAGAEPRAGRTFVDSMRPERSLFTDA